MATKFDTLKAIYTDFISPEDVAIRSISEDPKNSSYHSSNGSNVFSSLMNLLFPKTPNGFKTAEQMWSTLRNLGNDKDGELSKKFLADKIRFYHYDGTPDSTSGLESDIKNFYINGGRKSAYTYGSENKDDKNFRDIIVKALSSPDIVSKAKLSTKLTLILVDTPAIDLKLRNADMVSIFMNYMPSVMLSQMVPFLDARFVFDRQVRNDERKLKSMSQLKFLLGSEEIVERDANALIYDGSSKKSFLIDAQQTTTTSPDRLEARRSAGKRNPSQRQREIYAVSKKEEPQIDKKEKELLTTGMELFTMPQTLINMDYDQITTPRYNQTINSTVPFGTITNLSIDIRPSVGLFSFKTANLTLKIFDRSRLPEIADFLNPKLYQNSTVWLTYGWRAPRKTLGDESINYYNELINENMLKREAYGIRNSSITMESDGIATVTLSLFTKGVAEMTQAYPINSAAKFQENQDAFDKKISELKEAAEKAGLGSFGTGAKEIRGSQLIGAALGGTYAEIDRKTLDQELNVLRQSLSNRADLSAVLQKIEGVYKASQNSSKTVAITELEGQARNIAAGRILKDKQIPDFFAIYSGKFNDEPDRADHPLTKVVKTSSSKQNTPQRQRRGTTSDQSQDKGDYIFGEITFARVFSTYFATAAATPASENEGLAEYQVIFYSLNDLAGKVANVNIGDFPIEYDQLINAYAERVVKQKGENMSLVNFLELVRESQFSNIRHKAYGFSLEYFNDDGSVKKDQEANFFKALATANEGKAFVQPAIDFYIETGYVSTSDEAASQYHDLLTSFELASSVQATGVKNRSSAAYTQITRIHIYDKAATPHRIATTILRDDNTGDLVEVNDAFFKKWINEQKAAAADRLKNQAEEKEKVRKIRRRNQGEKPTEPQQPSEQSVESSLVDSLLKALKDSNKGTDYTVLGFKNIDGKARFQNVKKIMSNLVPTIMIGTNGTTVKNVSYSSNQDSLLSTIMMLRNNSKDQSPTQANGSGINDLPVRVIPGQLSLTSLGCPLIEYMQQFFVDLGTGTTIDNMYNVTGLTHNISPGNFTSEIKFTFLDAYGKYEQPNSLSDHLKKTIASISEASSVSNAAANNTASTRRTPNTPKTPKKN